MLEDLRGAVGDALVEDLLFAGEVAVDAGSGDTGSRADIVDSGRLVSASPEETNSRIEDQFASRPLLVRHVNQD